jgi:dihydropteroate synthase
MEFHEAANFLFDLGRSRVKPGTGSTEDLLAALGDPHEDLRAVQVAGSNGKGSTARMLAAVLREAGLSVGLYTSPHLDDFRERVRVDGRKMPKAAVAAFADAARDHVTGRMAAGEAATFFEAMTAMALWQFEREGVDVAILEVGIGGRLDATSVVDPDAAAVTTVSLEHTSILGDSVEAIARDMAHVAPEGAPLVTAADGTALAALRDVAGDVLTVGPEGSVRTAYDGRVNHTEAAVSVAGEGWSVEGRVPLVGAYQAANAGVAAALARQVADVDGDTMARGLRRAHWPGRFEVMDDAPVTVLDGAHNPAACERLAETAAEFDHEDLHLVVGAMADKDHRGMATGLPAADHAWACEPDVDRAADAAVLAEALRTAGHDDVTAAGAVPDALAAALAAARPGDMVLVAGSLFTVAEARRRWTRSHVPRHVETVADADAALSSADVPAEVAERLRDDAVHRAVRTRVRPRQARVLREELRSLGGGCAVSGLDDVGESVDAVLMGTRSEFRHLVDALAGRDRGLAVLARELRAALDLDGPGDGGDLPWSDGTAVMGVLNVTPDSFHDGGEYDRVEDAVARAEAMVAAGADVVDVGGESTRPGADPVSVDEEIARVVPVVERIADLDAAVSVDTRKAAVAEAALEAGGDVVNDVSGLEDPDMRFVAAAHDAPLVVMHSVNAPVDPDDQRAYDDVVDDVLAELDERVLLAEKAGLDRDRIVVDPGLGFGKTPEESFALLDRLDEFRALGCPVMVGHSHKSMFERAGADAGEAPDATVAATALAAERGADLVRVHDVAENVRAVRVAAAAETAGDGDM